MTTTPPTTTPPAGNAQVVPPAAPSGMNFGLGGTGAVQAPSAGAAQNVLISPDQSSLSQYVISQVGGSPVQTGLPAEAGPLASATTIGQALEDFYQLSPAQLVQLETMLWDGGYYRNGDGSPMQTAPTFGSYDPQSWTALARALEDASSKGTSLSSVVNNAVATGAGAAAHASLPSAVLGGGNVYQIDLTNPSDVKLAANQIFQAALGRNATDKEIQSVTSTLQGQQISQGYQQEAGKEQQSQAQYGAQQAQRNTAYTFATTPRVALGQIPTGPFPTNSSWAATLLGYMGLPVTTNNVAFVAALAAQLGGGVNSQSMNPLNVVVPQGGSQAGKGGVQSFQTWSQSLQSTAEELLGGKYQGLISALQTGNPTGAQGKNSDLSQSINVLTDGKVSKVNPSAAQTTEAATATFYWTTNAQQQQQAPTAQSPTPGTAGQNATAASMGAEGGGPGTAFLNPGTAQSMGAEGGGPNATALGSPTTNPADLNIGQQPPNPGDQYLNPVTTITTSPASADAAAYQAATTGANRPAYLGNNYLAAYQAILSMIKSGGPTQ